MASNHPNYLFCLSFFPWLIWSPRKIGNGKRSMQSMKRQSAMEFLIGETYRPISAHGSLPMQSAWKRSKYMWERKQPWGFPEILAMKFDIALSCSPLINLQVREWHPNRRSSSCFWSQQPSLRPNGSELCPTQPQLDIFGHLGSCSWTCIILHSIRQMFLVR